MIDVLTPTQDGAIARQAAKPIYQWVIVRDNCETYVAWATTKEEALSEFHDKGYSDEWKVLRKRQQL